MQSKEYINTQKYNNVQYRLRKEYDRSITLNEIYQPYQDWSNCTDIEYNIRITPKRVYISRYYFSDLSGQQRTYSNDIYVNRNDEIDNMFYKAMNFKDKNDSIETHAELKDIFDFFNEIYQNNGA